MESLAKRLFDFTFNIMLIFFSIFSLIAIVGLGIMLLKTAFHAFH